MQAFELKRTSTLPKAPPEQHRPFFASAVIQPKLAINQPGDQYEQESNAMADRVMRMTSVPPGGDGRCHRQGITPELPYWPQVFDDFNPTRLVKTFGPIRTGN